MILSEDTLNWISFAENDFLTVRELMKLHKKPPEIIAYHCQQTIEKYLKAILINNGEEVPYVHDLQKLNSLCLSFSPELATLSELCERLTPYGTISRYPGGSMIIDQERLPVIVQWTETIRSALKQLLELQETDSFTP